MIKFEAAKGRTLDPVRDRADVKTVNGMMHEQYSIFDTSNDAEASKYAKNDLLGEQYFSDATYSWDYFNRLNEAFKKYCHGFVPKIVESIAIVGEHLGQGPDDIAKHFNVRALKQMLRGTNDWVQAYVGSQMSIEDRNRFLSHPDRKTVTDLLCYKSEKVRTAGKWYLNHPTATEELVRDIKSNINFINITPDMRTEDVENQITLSGGERDINGIESRYGISVRDMEYNVRHSYSVNRNNGQVARTLLKGEEAKMVALGRFTCCCQELDGAGESAMMYGLIHPEAGFWVIEDDKGKVLAQAEIWEPYKDHDTIVFDNIEFADDRNISTVIDTLVQWCENSKYKNVIMGTGYNEIDYDKFPEAPINHPALSKKEVNILEEDMESENKETGVWKDGAYFVQYDSDPYLYSDALDKCVYLKHDGQIPQEVLDQCSDRYGKDAPVSDKQERYEQVDGELHDKYELAALLSDARYELKDKVPNGYRTLLNVGDDGKCTVCLYKGDDADNKVPFADVARREDGGLDITMRGEEQGLDGMENDIGDTVEDWDDNR